MMQTEEIVAWLEGADDEALFKEARRLRESFFGDRVFLRGIVEFSNHCVKRCRYCGLRAPNAAASRYRLSDEEIIDAAGLAVATGMGTVVLQSGDDDHYSVERLGKLIQTIKALGPVAVTLSLGDRPHDELAGLREHGADRYLLKLETLNPALYAAMRPGERLADRLERLFFLKSLGYEAGSGLITGLPGQDALGLARDILALSRLDTDMIAVGPFLPHPDTPLAQNAPGSLQMSLRALALLRILCPRANIPATSALDAVTPGGRALGLAAGANVVMPSLTPERVRADYNIYPGKNAARSQVRESVQTLKRMIRDTGLTPVSDRGDAPRSNHEPEGPARGPVDHRPGGQAQRGQILPD